MTIYVVYPNGAHKAVKEFGSAAEAIQFADRHKGKTYYEKEGIRYPDEGQEKTAHHGNDETVSSANKITPIRTPIIPQNIKE